MHTRHENAMSSVMNGKGLRVVFERRICYLVDEKVSYLVFNKNALVADSQKSAYGGDAWLQHRRAGNSQETISRTATVR
jgi:hypothetical protein